MAGLWWLYTRLALPVAGRVVSRPWYEVGKFLGPSISGFDRRHPVEDQLAMWRAAGIASPGPRDEPGGGVVVWGAKQEPDRGR